MFLKIIWIFVSLSLGVQHTHMFAAAYEDAIIFREYKDASVRFIETPVRALSFREGYKYIERTSLFYKEHRTPASWLDAVSKCKGEGAELALPKSRQEVLALKMQFSRMTEQIWLGLRDPTGNGNFLALDGTLANVTNLFARVVQGEEYVGYGDENQKCGTMNKNKQFAIFSCDLKLSFICMKKRSTIQYNPDCGSFKGYFLKPRALSCFKVHTEHRNWTAASQSCSKEKAFLATVDSQNEMNLFVDTMEGHPGSTKQQYFNNDIFWLGFSDHTGILKTVQGEPLVDADFIRWALRPSGGTRNRHCGSLHRDGRLEVANCGTKAMFFCEKSLIALNLNVDERK